MGDVGHSQRDLESIEFRKNTYNEFTLPNGFSKDSLAEVGFYFTRRGFNVKCFKCNIEIDLNTTDSKTNLIDLHKRLNSECPFAKELIELPAVSSQQRSKTFLSYDSLRYECERLETFIEWPVSFLMPADLAADGFYYLRTADHCACVFCRGIVGAWEQGDTPRGEHERHFSHCPFIRGQPVGNVPISQSNILSKLPPGASAQPQQSSNQPQQSCPVSSNKGIDQVGSRHMPGSYPECMGSNKNEINLEDIGLPQYSGPKRKDFLTTETRLESFNKWPERVTQQPIDLAEAGFFYCGLSDHVRCFHCGNGLRNWEADDCPWKEHARWYPDCNYILLKKGQEFVDTVRRENPPYKRSQNNEESLNVKKGANNQPPTSGTPTRPLITDAELDRLMELDIPRAVLGMGFPQRTVRATLKQKLEQTGMPFFGLESCIEAVLQFMEDETRQTLNERVSELEDEATQQQETKLQNISSQSNSQSTPEDLSSPSAVASTSGRAGVAAGSSILSTNINTVTPHLPGNELAQNSNIRVVPSPTPSESSAAVSTVTSTPTGEDVPPAPRGPVPKPRILSQPSPIVPVPTALPPTVEHPPAIPTQAHSASTTVTSSPQGVSQESSTLQPDTLSSAMETSESLGENSETPISTSVPLPTIPTQEHVASAVASSVPAVSQESSSIQPGTSEQSSAMETIESTGDDEVMDVDEDDTRQPVPSTSSNISHTPPLDRVILQADEVMTVAEAILKAPGSGPSSLDEDKESESQESKETKENVENPITPVGNATGISKCLPKQSPANLAEELEKIRDQRTCKVCMDAEMDVVFLPCAHMVTCSSCAATLTQCPICRANIRYTIKPIVS